MTPSSSLRRLVDFAVSVRDLFLTVLVAAVLIPLWILPWRKACDVGRFYGRIGFRFWGEGRRTGMINLRRAYGSAMTRAQAERNVRTVFENLTQSVVEAMQFVRRFPRPTGDAVPQGERVGGESRGGGSAGHAGWEQLCHVESPELVARLLSDPRPKIFVTGHFGSWEIAILILQRIWETTTADAGGGEGDRAQPHAAGAARSSGGGAGIARRVDNRWLDWLVKRVRLDAPSQWIEKRGAAVESLARLRGGESIVMLLDENGGSRGPFVDFFGRPASTRKTPAVLSLATGAPIIVGAVVRVEDRARPFLYRLAFIDPQAEGLKAPEDIVPITARITSILESWIREAPLQWRWVHWRWRTRPDGSREQYDERDLDETFAS